MMTLTRHLRIEAKKHKRRHNFLLFLGIVLIEMLFIYGNYRDEKELSDGWMILFYNMPIMNTLFFPVLLSTFASRLMDIEHKGDMLKCLYTYVSPRTIFFTKMVYGCRQLCLLVTLQCFSILLMGKILCFPPGFPASWLLFYGISTFISCILLFLLHLLLAYFFRNQAVSISAGLIGSFLGLFLAYLPPSFFQKFIPWSTFINSLFIRMDWNPDTRNVKWILLDFDYSPLLYNMFWIAALFGISIQLLQTCGVEENPIPGKSKNNYSENTYLPEKNTIHRLPIEIIKLKGSPSWFAFFIIPILSAIIGTLNYVNTTISPIR